jgi:DNA-binding winged helix-turn-helix (wHTH) protein/Flp pilus assembly protein TadD
LRRGQDSGSTVSSGSLPAAPLSRAEHRHHQQQGEWYCGSESTLLEFVMHFGPFALDERTWSLARDGAAVDLSPRLVEILAFFAGRPGAIVTKDELLERFWPDVHVAENTLTRAIADIRKAIGDDASQPRFLQTVARRGYRFIGGPSAPSDDVFAAWVKGRGALDSLDLTRLPGAIAAFERAVAELPSYAPAHAGLANAYLLQTETVRSGNAPNHDLVARAIESARRACSLDASFGEGWAVLGHLLSVAGKSEESQAAARRATALEPTNWRHHYRLALATWGEERLRAAERALALMPGFGPVYLLSAMVFVARGALDRAEHEVTLGADAQRQRRHDRTPLPAAGLHWIRGLVLQARGEIPAALASFDEEMAARTSGHVYAREFAVNARVAAGFTRLNLDDASAAVAEFRTALEEMPGHAKASLGLSAALMRTGDVRESEMMRLSTDEAVARLVRDERAGEAALVSAGLELIRRRTANAMEILDRLLNDAPAGPAGWIIPVDPMLTDLRLAPGQPALLARLAARAA